MFEMMLAGGKLPVPQGNIQKFEAGAAGIVALSNTGRLYSIGDQYFSGTGATTTTWGLLASGVEDFWVGFRGLLVKMGDGRWMFMGQNFMFPTALGSVITSLVDVSAYMTYTAGLTIKEVSMGATSIAVVFTNGQYAMCGQNGFGGLGQGNTITVRQLTMRTDFTNVKKIVFDWGGIDTSYMLLNTGAVYVAGNSDFGQAGVTSNAVTTWTLQAAVTTVIDIVGGNSGWFRVVETASAYVLYIQGRQFDGSLGTGSTSGVNYTSPTAVAPNITDKSNGPPNVQVGLYSARYLHPTGRVYYTGTSSGQLQGDGVIGQTIKYSFTALGTQVLDGEYHATSGAYKAAYLLINGTLYGTGQDTTTGLLPGLGTTRVYTFVPLDTTAVI